MKLGFDPGLYASQAQSSSINSKVMSRHRNEDSQIYTYQDCFFFLDAQDKYKPHLKMTFLLHILNMKNITSKDEIFINNSKYK